MKDAEVCHGIPSAQKHVTDGELIKIDVGLLYQGYHLDTTTTVLVGTPTPVKQEFLAVGKKALQKAISMAKAGNTVFDVSFAMQKIVERHGYGMVYQLTGHGVGEELHQKPEIPCVAQRADKKQVLYDGQTIAVEVMYTMGNPYLELDKDGWTFKTADGSIAGMIEETVLVTENGPEILTSI
jgi:methionyl aminopeptidase